MCKNVCNFYGKCVLKGFPVLSKQVLNGVSKVIKQIDKKGARGLVALESLFVYNSYCEEFSLAILPQISMYMIHKLGNIVGYTVDDTKSLCSNVAVSEITLYVRPVL